MANGHLALFPVMKGVGLFLDKLHQEKVRHQTYLPYSCDSILKERGGGDSTIPLPYVENTLTTQPYMHMYSVNCRMSGDSKSMEMVTYACITLNCVHLQIFKSGLIKELSN